MPVIANEQIDALKALAIQKFEQEMLEQTASYAPKLHALYGDKVFQTVIRQGIQQAFGYGFTYRGPVRFYLELMFSLGYRFDTDPQYPWCKQILDNRKNLDQVSRAEQLFGVTDRYVSNVMGKENRHVSAALQRFKGDRTFLIELFQDEREIPILPVMRRYYPEKTRFLGRQALSNLIHEAWQEARNYDIATPKGANLLSLLMFAFGHAVIDDPLYPWVKRTLTGNRFTQQNQRIDRLSAKTLTYISAVGNYFIRVDSA